MDQLPPVAFTAFADVWFELSMQFSVVFQVASSALTNTFKNKPTITHRNCETALLSLFNAMPILHLMHGAEKNLMKYSKTIR